MLVIMNINIPWLFDKFQEVGLKNITVTKIAYYCPNVLRFFPSYSKLISLIKFNF